MRIGEIMGRVTIRADLLAELQAVAENEGQTPEEVANRAIERFLRERAEASAPDWHVPLVRRAMAQVEQGRVLPYSRERILTRTKREPS